MPTLSQTEWAALATVAGGVLLALLNWLLAHPQRRSADAHAIRTELIEQLRESNAEVERLRQDAHRERADRIAAEGRERDAWAKYYELRDNLGQPWDRTERRRLAPDPPESFEGA